MFLYIKHPGLARIPVIPARRVIARCSLEIRPQSLGEAGNE